LTSTTHTSRSVVLVTTADTDILTADRALNGLPEGSPQVRAYHPVALDTEEARQDLMGAAAV